WRHVRRETKKEFWKRVEREGRKVDAERALAKMLASHMSQREAQEKLVERFQPLDGSQTRGWGKPNPWICGRLVQSKEDQDEALVLAEDEEYASDQDIAQDRLKWARLRRDEAQALAAWRDHARKLKADARRRRRSRKATSEQATSGSHN